MRKKLVICGGGSSSHTLIPFLKDSIFDVYVYTSHPEKWSKTIDLEWHDPSGKVQGSYSGDINKVSNDPKELFPDADYVVFCMPVHKYRVALHEIGPYLNKDKDVFVGTVYGQGGWNWMVDEIKKQFGLSNIVSFAFGLIPWICRQIKYGEKGVTYGCKAVNYAACYPKHYFKQIDEELLEQICYRWFGKGKVEQADNFLSLSLSVDNQIIHTSRCLGLYKVYGRTWPHKEDVPWFYRDYDDVSANLLASLDDDYTKIRQAIIKMHPEKDYRYMLDYLALERFSYQSQNTDVKESFVTSQTLVSIQTPVVQNSEGLWEVDRNHRFFLDDIYYGNCIAKWMAEKLDIETPTIDEILHWAQLVRGERIIDDKNRLILDSPDLTSPLKCGIPSVYGFNSIEDCID
ncbi:MAG: NAD/NADP octopine/nopaline dehydrogenase family protein [Muribaculaceae bacterium]|nr:NAD/NADP octopine/nopaline dehydrogenase family protein [Muribaculaceae bacterium]